MSISSPIPSVATRPKRPMPAILWVLIIVGAVGGATFVVLMVIGLVFMISKGGSVESIRGFKIESNSMCPTICQGEHIVADMNAYVVEPPQRGSLILFHHGEEKYLFTKRVVGLPGDKITVDDAGKVSVNGRPVTAPRVCGSPKMPETEPGIFVGIRETVVPAGELFVVGENINSNDSRIESFGPVKYEDVQGKPEMIYVSPGKGRFGCILR